MSEVKNKTLADLQPGDKVVMRRDWSRSEIKEVTRVTNTQIMISGAMGGTERKFWKKNGKEVGSESSYYQYRIIVADEAEMERVKLSHRREVINGFQFRIAENDATVINKVFEWLLAGGFIPESK